ncbi:uncharacterized protein DUF3788 [Breznakia blatticola]|uniref:Uncharacterized protein DUF3788 n=1 Tax=Breznakia blatticola TaxID=1754012 RepID=A0A4R8A3Q3_9FIRM|nr:DUF3788 family protein [Breznakia blatticola]TDW25122.1 uncharacterized protein DUF3788 [Breznakia blatticola]
MIDFKKDKNIEPTDDNLKIVLKDSFLAYKELTEKLSDFNVNLEWRFYKDGGWLAKATHKKKTIFWGQAMSDCFLVAFHFNKKTIQGVYDLNIAETFKQELLQAQNDESKFTSLRLKVVNSKSLPNIYQLIEYKCKV